MPPIQLPPLILYPFADSSGPGKLVDASRASLMLSGVIPQEQDAAERLQERLLTGRYCELTMLFYLGKDLLRWAAQCVDSVERMPELSGAGFRNESFTTFLVEDTPPEVRRKLVTWGVNEYRTIFTRALGLHAVFETLPPREELSFDFTQHYHQFADHFFTCQQQLFHFQRIEPQQFEFQLYASNEYSRMLEQEWGTV
jgi:hypothetical protein